MGEASALVGKKTQVRSKKEEKKLSPRLETVLTRILNDVDALKQLVKNIEPVEQSLMERVERILEDLDKAIQIKENDLHKEGDKKAPENHYKLGILKGSESLIRRAYAMLEDYDGDSVNLIDESDEDEEEEEEEDNDFDDEDDDVA